MDRLATWLVAFQLLGLRAAAANWSSAFQKDDVCGEGESCADGLHALQMAVSSDGSSHRMRSPDSLQASVDQALFPLYASRRLAGANESCGRCLRSCLPSEDPHFRGKADYEECVRRCPPGCDDAGLPEVPDLLREGIRGPQNETWGAWMLGLRQLKKELADIQFVSGAGEYASAEFKRSSAAYVTVQTMVHDRRLYNPEKHTWTAARYLDDLTQRFGGVDQILLWAGYPNLGVDTRSNLEMMEAVPGGLRAAVQALKEEAPSMLVQIPYKPWDIATDGLGKDDPQRYAELAAKTGVDGLNLDTMDSLGPFLVGPGQSRPVMPVTTFFNAAKQAGILHLIVEPELNLYNGLFLLNTTAQGWLYTLSQCPPTGCSEVRPFVPLVSLQKWVMRTSLPHVCGRWSTARSQEILTAYFNAIGFTAWENIFGIWNGISQRDGELLRRATRILRHFHHFLTDAKTDWLPFYPVEHLTAAGSHVFVSKFVGEGRALFLLINTGNETAGTQDWQLPTPMLGHQEFYSIYHGNVQIQTKSQCLVQSCFNRRHGKTAVLRVAVEGRGIGAILQVGGGQLTPGDLEIMRRMDSISATRLETFEDKAAPVVQLSSAMKHHKATPRDTTGMVAVRGQKAYEFRIVGSEIEDTRQNGKQFVKLAVDVQYPWETEPVKYHRAHTMSIADLYVDKYPVTNELYAAFLKQSLYAPVDSGSFLRHWGCQTSVQACSMPPSLAKKPVVFVSRQDAEVFCHFYGKRLPREWEWQYVAQAGDPDRTYPWGQWWWKDAVPAPQENASVFGMGEVGRFPNGSSPAGVEDLVGLVWQWTDEYQDEHNRAAILRGGSVFRPNAHDAAGVPDPRYQPWYFPGRAPAGAWDAQWTGDHYFGPKDYSSLFKNTVHAKYLLMAPSLDRAGTIGFRCVADRA